MKAKTKIKVALTLALVIALCGFFLMAGTLLIRNDQPEPGAPYIVALMGDESPTRASMALAMLKADEHAKLLFGRERPAGFVKQGLKTSDADLYSRYLVENGVPPERLIIISDCDSTSTVDEAQCILRYLRAFGPLPVRLPIVTSWYHTSRAGWLFENIWRETGTKIEMAPALPEDFDPKDWWQEEDSLIAVQNEYVKWIYWVLKMADSEN